MKNRNVESWPRPVSTVSSAGFPITVATVLRPVDYVKGASETLELLNQNNVRAIIRLKPGVNETRRLVTAIVAFSKRQRDS
jgi:hypothetical protein